MKLQRNNKYSNKIATSLACIILNMSILMGCASNTANAIETTPIQVEEKVSIDDTKIEEKDADYYLSYYKINNDEVEKRYNKLNVKYPNALWSMGYMATILVRDSYSNYKVILAIAHLDKPTNRIEVFDLATEEKLFDFPNTELTLNDNGRYENAKLEMADNKIDYFKDKEIVAYGCITYEINFLNDILNELKEKDGKNYELLTWLTLAQIYNGYIDFASTFKHTEQLLKEYIKYVPIDNQVTSEELGLVPSYSVETKYADSWKIDEEEISKRIETLNIYDKNEKVSMGGVNTLVLKDKNAEYKLLNVIATYGNDDAMIEFYDLFTKNYLFTLKSNKSIKYDNKTGLFSNVDFSNMIDSIDYFEDKEICYMADCIEVNKFLIRNLDELSERDGIKYESPHNCILYNLFPYGSYSIENKFYTIEQYARNYVTLPEDMIVTAKELGFEK